MRNYIKLGRYMLGHGLWDDGTVWLARLDGRIVWSAYLPTWIVKLYNRIAR